MFFPSWRLWKRWLGADGGTRPIHRNAKYRPGLEALEERIVPTGSWTALTNLVPGPGGTGTMLLLSDGTVMVAGNTAANGISQNWYLLTPDGTGSYVNGSFSALASMHTQREFFASDVLPSGRVFVAGGQYSNDNNGTSGNDTNTAEIYNPALNTWTSLPNFPATQLGDAVSEVLPDGSVLVGDPFGNDTQIFTPSGNTGSWSAGPSRSEDATSAEESWLKLGDGSILSYDIQDGNNPHHAERYIPSLSEWIDAGTVPVQLESNGGNSNIVPTLGPAVLLPDGRAFFLGASGHTAFYTPPTTLLGTGTWSAGPDIPDSLGAFDAPAAMLDNGKVLIAASTIDGINHSGPTTIFEFDPTANGGNGSFTTVPDTGGPDLSNGALMDRMLDLPNGQVLFTNGTRRLYVYTPDGSPLAAAMPTVAGIANNGSFFTLSGTQLTGISEGAEYGDDAQMASNYPIIRLIDGNGNVSYTRTANWSSMWPQTGSTVETVDFEAPAVGPYLLSVSANGVSSSPVLFVNMGPGADAITLRDDPANVSKLQVLQNGSTLLGEFPLSSFKSIDVNGTGSLTIDHSNGDFGGEAIIFNGGATSSTIAIGGKSGSLSSLGYNVNGAGAGELLIDRDTLTFTSVQSIIDSVASSSGLTINIDPSNSIPGLITTTFAAGTGANTGVTFSNGLTPMTFANPGILLRVTGHSGDDHIIFDSLGTGFHDTVAVNDLNQGGNDTVDVNTPLNLSTPTSRGDLTVYASSINLDANIDVGSGIQGSVSLQGNIMLMTDVSMTYGVNGLNLGSGNLAIGTNNLTLTDVDSTNTGFVQSEITGTGNLYKTGPGRLIVYNTANTFSGLTTVSAGTLEVNGTLAAIAVNGGTLSGDGTTGTVNVTNGGVTPGQGSTPGVLTTGAVTLAAGSSFNIGIGGNTAGDNNSSYAQEAVSAGTVTLAATLNLSQVANYVPQSGEYAILQNGGGSAFSGTFVAGAGIDAVSPGTALVEGAVLSDNFLGSHLIATITYTAGSGNDSVAIVISGPPAITSANDTTFTVGMPGSFTVKTTGFPRPALNDGNFAFPSNISFKDNGNGTATLAGIPGTNTGGRYTFTITAHNGIGNDATQSFTLTIDQPAGITSPAGVTFSVGTFASFIIQTTGFPTPNLSDGGFNLPAGLSFADNKDGTATLSGTPGANTGGSYNFTITAHNGIGGDAGQGFTLTVDQALMFTTAASTAFTVGTQGSYTIRTNGFPTPSLNDGMFTPPAGITFTDNGDGTATLAGTPDSTGIGTYNFTITAQNGVSNDITQGFTLTVNEAPSITSPNNAAFTAGVTGSFDVTAGGYPVPALSILGAPVWVSFTPRSGLMSIAPPMSAVGKYVFTVKAVNTLGTASQIFTLTINPPPSLTPALLPPGTLNNFYNQTISAMGGTGTKTLTYSVSGTLPAGLSIAPVSPADNSIQISGTPTALATATINISVSDTVGATASGSFTVRIVSIALVPDFLSPGRTMLVVGTSRPDPLGTYIQPVDTLGDLSVTVNGVPQGTYKPTGHILVYGNGNDAIHLKAGANGTTVSVPAFLIGGGGNETLDASGSSANNLLVGAAGKNVLTGGTGRDILIGGPMYSVLLGGHNQDVLISGSTTYDQNLFALNAVISEWGRQDENLNTRVGNLQSGAGVNAPYFLSAGTVTVDVPPEAIIPGSGQNWLIDAPFLVGPAGALNHVMPTLNFAWSSANGADHYLLLLTDMTTGQVVILNLNVSGTSYRLPTSALRVGHSYRWWIQPVAANGQAGFRSNPCDFQII